MTGFVPGGMLIVTNLVPPDSNTNDDGSSAASAVPSFEAGAAPLFQSSKDFRALTFWKNWAAFPFQLARACVAIQPDDQSIPQFARQFEAADVAGMEQIKAAIGESDTTTVPFVEAKQQNRLLKCQDRRTQKVSKQNGRSQSGLS